MNNDIMPSRPNDSDKRSTDNAVIDRTGLEEAGYRPQPIQGHSSDHDKKKRGKAAPVLAILLTLMLLGAALLAYLWLDERAESQSAREALAITQKENTLLKAAGADKGDVSTEQDTNPLTQEEQVLLESSNYYCQIQGFGCDKVNATISKLQKHELTPSQPGFAIVKASGTNGVIVNLYLKSTDGLRWAVVYDGQNTPPQDVVDRFAIPEEFLPAA